MSVPVMRMGLVGFADERQLRNLLATRNRNLRWERWGFMDADALWINGENAQPLPGNMVRVPAVEAGHPATLLNLKEIDRPTAFTLPIRNRTFTPPLAFDPQRVDQVADVLNQFEADLLPVAADLTLAAEIANRRRQLASSSYHLSLRGRLLALFSVTGEVGMSPHVSPHEIMEADWAGRPASGGDVPSHFRRTSMAHIMWQYVMRTADDLLPSRYARGTVHWRRMPAVPTKWVREEHMLLVSVLTTGPQTLQSLVDHTALPEQTVRQALAALYFGGSLTTDPAKASPSRTAAPARAPLPSRPPAGDDDWPSSMTSAASRPGRVTPQFDMPTVPSPLDVPGKKK